MKNTKTFLYILAAAAFFQFQLRLANAGEVDLNSQSNHAIKITYQKDTNSSPGGSPATSTVASQIRISIDLSPNCDVSPKNPVVAKLYGITSDGAEVIQFVHLQVTENCIFEGTPVYSLLTQTTDPGGQQPVTNFNQNIEIDVGNIPQIDPNNKTAQFNFTL